MKITWGASRGLSRGRWPKGWQVALGAGLLLAFVPLGLGLRGWVEAQVQKVALGAVWRLDERLRSSRSAAVDEELPLFPRWGGPESERPRAGPASPSLEQAPKGSARGATLAAPQALLPEPHDVAVDAARVLDWANRRVVPVGRPRSAGYGLPAGIELSKVAGLGIGLLDGDRLVAVNGVAVMDRSQVVSLVLGARARREPHVVASLWRRTRMGPRPFSVQIAQPYLEVPTGADGVK